MKIPKRLRGLLADNVAALTVLIPVFATMALSRVCAWMASDGYCVYGCPGWSMFGDALIVLIFLMSALCFRQRWCAAAAAVLACANLLLRIFALVLYRKAFMSTDFHDVKMLWQHTDGEALRAFLGPWYALWLIPAVLAVSAAVAGDGFLAWRTIRNIGRRMRIVWLVFTGVLLAMSIYNIAGFLRTKHEYPLSGVYTGHLVRPQPISAALFVRDALRSPRRNRDTPPSIRSRRIMEDLAIIPHPDEPKSAPPKARFDRIVIIAMESLDLEFIGSLNPKMPEGITPNLDRLIAGRPAMLNYFCSAQPTSWGLTGILMSRMEYEQEQGLAEPRTSLFRIASSRGYVSCYFSPITGVFAENRRIYGELFGPDRLYFLEDWARKYNKRRSFSWGMSDREIYECALNEMNAMRDRRFVVLISTMDTHPPYTADGISEEDERRFTTPFLRGLHMADHHLGVFLQRLMADRELYNDRTLIVVTADHTATHGENYLKRKRLVPGRIPLIFITPDPNVFRKLDRNKYASSIDLTPTLVNFIGGGIPDSFMGRDLFSPKNIAVSWYPDEKSGILFMRSPKGESVVSIKSGDPDPEKQAVRDFFRSHYGTGEFVMRPGILLFLGSAAFLLFLSAIPFAGAVCLKYRPERMFAAGLLLNVLLFYFACALNLCHAGFCVIFSGNLALFVPALLKLRKEPEAIRYFRTPGSLVIYLALAAGFMLALREKLLWWDEFSHWASSSKLLLEHGRLNCEFADVLKHASYPPGLAVLNTLVHKCFFGMEFRDFMPRFAIRAAKICLFALPFADIPGRKTFRECAAGMALLWLLTSVIFFDGNFTCESDCILGMSFAAAVYAVMRHDRSVKDDLFIALLLAWLFLIKKAGMGFAVMTQVLYVVRWIADRRSGETPKRPVWSALLVLGAPYAMQATWSLLLKIHHTPIIFAVGRVSPGGIWRLIRYGEPAHCREVAARFGRSLIGFLPEFLAAVVALFWYRRAAGNRPRRDGCLWWFLPSAFAVYLVSLFLSYMFIFNASQACRLVSLRRYLYGFMIMPLGVMAMLIISGGWRGKFKSVLTSYVAIVLMLAAEARFYRYEEECGSTIAERWPNDRAVIDARYGHILRAPGVGFVVLSGVSNGICHPIFRYEFGAHFIDERPLNRADGMTPQAIGEFIRGRRYVLIVMPPKDAARDFAELWESPPDLTEDFTLFEVTPEGRLRPVR